MSDSTSIEFMFFIFYFFMKKIDSYNININKEKILCIYYFRKNLKYFYI